MNDNRREKVQLEESRTSRWSILAAWLIVSLPLSWGVYQSMVKSLPLFQSTRASR